VGNCGAAGVESAGDDEVSVVSPTLLTASEPAPVHGSPVSGLVPVLSPLSSELGVDGETGTSTWLGSVKGTIWLGVCADAATLPAEANRIKAIIRCRLDTTGLLTGTRPQLR
jgi:hypothetical protein